MKEREDLHLGQEAFCLYFKCWGGGMGLRSQKREITGLRTHLVQTSPFMDEEIGTWEGELTCSQSPGWLLPVLR